MPLTIGGGINSFDHAARIFDAGADKLLIGSLLHEDPAHVEKVASYYGSQSIVASLDCQIRRRCLYHFLSFWKSSVSKAF